MRSIRQFFFSSQYVHHLHLHPFPKRRSSDLDQVRWAKQMGVTIFNFSPGSGSNRDYMPETEKRFVSSQKIMDDILAYEQKRSEEHTSELQSRRDLVCRLLLEKKKKHIKKISK